jgi:hypothetical protein
MRSPALSCVACVARTARDSLRCQAYGCVVCGPSDEPRSCPLEKNGDSHLLDPLCLLIPHHDSERWGDRKLTPTCKLDSSRGPHALRADLALNLRLVISKRRTFANAMSSSPHASTPYRVGLFAFVAEIGNVTARSLTEPSSSLRCFGLGVGGGAAIMRVLQHPSAYVAF